MTKSVKEKARLEKIRYCNLNDIPVPAELLKINISYQNKISRKNLFFTNIRETFGNRNWLKTHFSFVFDDINNNLISIARNLNIYDFDILFSISYGFHAIPEFDIWIELHLYSDKHYIGKILLNNRINYSKSPVPIKLKATDIATIESIQPIINDYKNNWTSFPFVILLNHYNSVEHARYFPKTKLSKFIKNLYSLKMYYSNLFNIKIVLNVKYIINDNINISIHNNDLSYIISNHFSVPIKYHVVNAEKFNKITFLDMLNTIGAISINIPEEDFIMENIDEIEQLIKLNLY